MKAEALKKDITRFVKRQLDARKIERKDGRLKTIQTDLSQLEAFNRNTLFVLYHHQVDIRDVETRKLFHVLKESQIRNISDTPLESLFGSVGSAKEQSWKDLNLVIRVKQGMVIRHYDKDNKTRLDEFSNPYRLRYIIDLPKLLYENENVTILTSYDTKDIEAGWKIGDLPNTKELIFDLIKEKSPDTESLTLRINYRGSEEGYHSPQKANGQIVKDLLSGKKVYALRLAVKNPVPGRDYNYDWQP